MYSQKSIQLPRKPPSLFPPSFQSILAFNSGSRPYPFFSLELRRRRVEEGGGREEEGGGREEGGGKKEKG